jgi:hypothetical protein
MLVCRYCPAQEMVWSRLFDGWMCPDCRGVDYEEIEEEQPVEKEPPPCKRPHLYVISQRF